MWIVIVRQDYYGPFRSGPDARTWAETHVRGFDWHVRAVRDPATIKPMV